MSVSEADFMLVRQLMYEDAGLVLDEDKNYLVRTRLQKLAQARGLELPALLALLHRSNAAPLRAQVVDAMAIQETYFFRDPWLFEALRKEVLPALLTARAPVRQLRIWSAACSTGQEVYSLCLMLREEFPALQDWDLEIVASDFSEAALARARSGRYSLPEVNRGLPARLLMKYFQQRDLEWELHREVRRTVRFMPVNLVRAWPELPRFDLVLLRNVLIYFDDATRRDVLERMRGQMQDDACLFLGASETPLSVTGHFRPSQGALSCYYRIAEGGSSQ